MLLFSDDFSSPGYSLAGQSDPVTTSIRQLSEIHLRFKGRGEHLQTCRQGRKAPTSIGSAFC